MREWFVIVVVVVVMWGYILGYVNECRMRERESTCVCMWRIITWVVATNVGPHGWIGGGETDFAAGGGAAARGSPRVPAAAADPL